MDALEWVVYGGPIKTGVGLPDPVHKPQARKEAPKPITGRLANAQTRTWEWDVKSRVNVNANADTTLTNREIEMLVEKKCKNGPWNASIKVSRVRGRTIAEAAKDAGCSPSYAGKVYSILSQCE